MKVLRPVFAGQTQEGEKITLYQHIDTPEELHLLRPDGEMWVLSPGSEVKTWVERDMEVMVVEIESPEWTGQARGSRWDLLSADAR